MDYFPIVKGKVELYDLLEDIHSNSEDYLILEKFGGSPVEPVCPKKPFEPLKPKSDNTGLIMFLVMVVITIFITNAYNQPEYILLVVFVSIVAFIIQVLNGNINLDESFTMKQYKSDYINYLKDVEEYKSALVNFEEKTIQYDNERKIYNKKVYDFRNSENYSRELKIIIHQKFDELYNHLELKNKYPTFVLSKLPIKGITENFFHNYLIKYFGKERIFVNQQFNYYFPDFVLFSPRRICIDIEIDEPYSLKTREPIHYVTSDGERIDSDRDAYFSKNYWLIIRFTENQVLNQPELCCKFIAKYCRFLNIYFENKFDDEDSDSLDKEPWWTLNQAVSMSLDKTRENIFLNKKIIIH